MKKSNKLTIFYVLSSVTLFLVLLFGGIYGVYVSVGLNFVRGTVTEGVAGGGVSNVSFGGNVNYAPSMAGVIFLSIILVIISVFDFITLLKQIVFFKQFKAVQKSNLTKKVEQKTPSKGGVIFWTFFIDIMSFIAGIVGLFINGRCFVNGNEMSWLFYLIDGLVSILSLISIILLIAKLKNKAIAKSEHKINRVEGSSVKRSGEAPSRTKKKVDAKEINQIEYNLMKLDSMKKNKIVTDEEYKKLRKKIFDFKNSDKVFDESMKDY